MIVKAIQVMQRQYYSSYGRNACSLTELGPPSSGAPGPTAADLIGSDLASGLKQGYKFTVECSADGYTVRAVPETYGTSGNRTFYSDQTMEIHEHYGPEPATVQDPVMK
jgi:type IV pilus assembly protein PilA